MFEVLNFDPYCTQSSPDFFLRGGRVSFSKYKWETQKLETYHPVASWLINSCKPLLQYTYICILFTIYIVFNTYIYIHIIVLYIIIYNICISIYQCKVLTHIYQSWFTTNATDFKQHKPLVKRKQTSLVQDWTFTELYLKQNSFLSPVFDSGGDTPCNNLRGCGAAQGKSFGVGAPWTNAEARLRGRPRQTPGLIVFFCPGNHHHS